MGNTAKRDSQKGEMLRRRRRALQLRDHGFGYRVVADKLGVSIGQAWKDVEAALAEIRGECREQARETRELELGRLDRDWRKNERVLRNLEKRMADADDETAAKLGATIARLRDSNRKIQERRARYLGLDAPTKAQLTGPNDGPVVVTTADDVLARVSKIAERLGVGAAAGDCAREGDPGPESG